MEPAAPGRLANGSGRSVGHDGLTLAGPPPADVRASVKIDGDLSGLLVIGNNNIVEMRIDTMTGNLITQLPPGSKPTVKPRPVPVLLRPRRPLPMFDRRDETALTLSALSAGQVVEFYAAPGMGKSTLLRHLAHNTPLGDSCGGVAHLSARGQSRDDLLQSLFDVFYESDVPVKPTSGQLKHYLQHARAGLLLDDVTLPAAELRELGDFAPECGLVLAAEKNHGLAEARSVGLSGLPDAEARTLLAHALGRPLRDDEQQAAMVLSGLAQGIPQQLLQIGAAAGQFAGSLDEYAASVGAAPPVLEAEDEDDRRLLGMLAVLPELRLGAEQLKALTGLADVQGRLDRWVARGIVQASPPAAGMITDVTYGLAGNVDVRMTQTWALASRRAEIRDYFLGWAQTRGQTVTVPSQQADTLRVLQSAAETQLEWRDVVTLGTILDAPYAVSGRWDAWREILQATLRAAQAIGDKPAEAMAQHQLGTRSLCLGDTAAARALLTAALQLRLSLGDTAGADVTRHNLSLLPPIPAPPEPPTRPEPPWEPPPPPWWLEAIIRYASLLLKTLLVLLPLAGLLYVAVSLLGTGVRIEPTVLSFGEQMVHTPTAAQSFTIDNTGFRAPRIIDLVVVGRDAQDFHVGANDCTSDLREDAPCTADVLFAPTAAGPREAELRIDTDPSAGASIVLTGDGLPMSDLLPDLDPAALSFDTQQVATQSNAQAVRVTSRGDGALAFPDPELTGSDALDFTVAGNDCSTPVASLGSCSVEIRFNPTQTGTRVTALVLRSTGEQHVTMVVPLTGTATPPPTGAPQVAPASLDFGVQQVGLAGESQTVVVSNPGTAAVKVATIRVDGPGGSDYRSSDLCGPVGPGSTCAIAVRFTASATGSRPATLVLDTDSPGPPLAVPLTGEGVEAGDLTAPIITASDLTAEATSKTGAVITTYRTTARDAVDGDVPLSCDPEAGGTIPLGVTTVTCVAVDHNDNSTTGTFKITLQNTTPPTVTVPAAQSHEATEPGGARISDLDVRADDAVDGPVTATCLPLLTGLFPLDANSLTCTARDSAGNDSPPATFVVTVVDTTPPTLEVPENVDGVEATGPQGATIPDLAARATDLVDGPLPVQCDPKLAEPFRVGTTTVKCTAKDRRDNTSAPGTFTVTIRDTTPPVTHVPPQPVMIEATGPEGATLDRNIMWAEDLVDGRVPPTCTPSILRPFPINTVTVACDAKDKSGNTSARATFTVTVQDTTAPKLKLPKNLTVETTSSAGAVVKGLTATAFDVVDLAVTPDCKGPLDGPYPLGSTERGCKATDRRGNVSSPASFTVTVRDTTLPTLKRIGELTVWTSSDSAEVDIQVVTSDTVDGELTARCTPPLDGSFRLGETSVTCMATDKAGNEGKLTFTVTVEEDKCSDPDGCGPAASDIR